MRKEKFVCGMLALCLALSVAGCGKNSEEKQAANYYRQELGLDKDEAEDLAHELYGKDEEEEEPSVSEEAPREIVVEPLPELLNSEWYDCKVQFYDMVFDNFMDTTEEDIRKSVEGSVYDIELTEDFDSDGEICLRGLMVDGVSAAQFWKNNRPFNIYNVINDFVKYGLLTEGEYYSIAYGRAYHGIWFDKASIEFEDFKTRDDVLAYLVENGFVEAEGTVYATGFTFRNKNQRKIYPDDQYFEYADVPHYLCKGAQSITLYRMHKLSETDQEIEGNYRHYSGAHLNLVNRVTFEFNTDGTIVTEVPSYDYYVDHLESMLDKYIPGFYSLYDNTGLFMIAGEQID